ncbi:hypothetical protein G6F56_013512 [Rhizopus delemar]|nr:hypothetical protein G6F56_013512 [Rhizopus delemar]
MAGAVEAAKVGQVTGDLVQVAQDALDALGTLGLVIDPFGHQVQALGQFLSQVVHVIALAYLHPPLAQDGLAARFPPLLRAADGQLGIFLDRVFHALYLLGDGARVQGIGGRPSPLKGSVTIGGQWAGFIPGPSCDPLDFDQVPTRLPQLVVEVLNDGGGLLPVRPHHRVDHFRQEP